MDIKIFTYIAKENWIIDRLKDEWCKNNLDISTESIDVQEADHGIAIQASLKYVPLDITEKLQFKFDENSLLRLS